VSEPEVKNPATMAVTGNFSLQAQLPNGKTFSVSGYLYDSESLESVNQRVDLMHDVLDRQRLRAEIPELEAKRDQMIKQLDQMRDHMAGLERKKETSGKLSSQEKLSLDNIGQSISKVLEEIEKGGKAIADAKKKVGIE